jgi:N-acetylglucosaminyl-diphospho-decaprenol L-rhamnosyltransferase
VDVTVSIVNHDNRDAVLASLAALAADEPRAAETEVIVVDNVSQDGSAAAIRAAYPDVTVIERSDRAGFGANHNLGLRHAKGRHVLMLNDDARVGPGAIDALSRCLDEQPDVAMAAPTVVSPKGVVEPTFWPRPSLRLDVLGALRPGRPPSVEAGSGTPIGWVTGCAMMVRRDAVAAVGGFDEGFFMYSDEIDLCTRLVDAGHRIARVPEATVIHEGQLSTGLNSPERAVEMARSRRRYWRKHYSRPARLAAQAVVGAQFAAMALKALLLRRPARPMLLQAASCFRDLGEPGLRERAEEFNRSHGTGGPGSSAPPSAGAALPPGRAPG